VTPVKNLKGNWFAAGNHSSTEIQAVLLLSQLRRISHIIAARKTAFDYLNKRFSEEEAIYLPLNDTAETKSTHHLYLLRINPEKAGGNIQDLKKLLTNRGITQIPHFGPLYHFDICRKMGYRKEEIAESCPNTEQVFTHEYTHLPLYPLSQDQLEYLADQVLDAVRELKG
jgi:dTDP-4-amino-4,6-dideoxygalactose transaminase